MGPKAMLALACVASLLAGGATGVALDHTVLRGRPPERRPGRPEGGRRGGGPGVGRLAERLDLDKKQVEEVEKILEASRPRFAAIMDSVKPQLRALHEEQDAEIRKVLRPEQAEKLTKLRQEWENERSEPPKR
jgi:Spy/CpxP family protein refolding chaperone